MQGNFFYSTCENNHMLQLALLLMGFILMLLQYFLQPFGFVYQLFIFIAGIVILGVPHGAADLLVAMQNAGTGGKNFSKLSFFKTYLGRLILFAAALWLFPIIGLMLFILFAAYHFGETDLHHCKTDSLPGKLFVTTYGLVILSVILLVHLDEVIPIMQTLLPALESEGIFNFLNTQRTFLIAINGIVFMLSAVIYLYQSKIALKQIDLWYMIRFVLILIIIFNLPLILGFSFYFIVWHSVLSMTNIFQYLLRDNRIPFFSILKQIGLYSLLAMGGIMIVGLAGIMFLNSHTLVGYVLMGLAVLTAPHMQVMHDMYNKMRAN